MRCADVNQTEPADDVGGPGLKGSNVNHNNLPNSDQQPGATGDAAAPVSICIETN